MEKGIMKLSRNSCEASKSKGRFQRESDRVLARIGKGNPLRRIVETSDVVDNASSCVPHTEDDIAKSIVPGPERRLLPSRESCTRG